MAAARTARAPRRASESSRHRLQQLTPDQVGELLGISRDSVEALIAGGHLKAIDVRTQGTRPRLRVSEAALEDFIDSRALESGTTPNRPRAVPP